MPESNLQVIAAKLGVLHDDVSEVKTAMKDLSVAITKLAVVEERQANTNQAMERAFTAISETKADIKSVGGRVSALETLTPLNKKANDWMFAAIWAVAGFGVFTVLKLAGVM